MQKNEFNPSSLVNEDKDRQIDTAAADVYTAIKSSFGQSDQYHSLKFIRITLNKNFGRVMNDATSP